jgi:hypothetical protein
MEGKVTKFQYDMRVTIRRCLRNKTKRYVQLKCYKRIKVPVLIYGAETRDTNRRLQKNLETAEMWFSRSVTGVTLLYQEKEGRHRRRPKNFQIDR